MVTDQHVAEVCVFDWYWQLCHGCRNSVALMVGFKLKGGLVRDSLGFVYCTQQCCDAFQIYVKPYRDQEVAAYAKAHDMNVGEAVTRLKEEAKEEVLESLKENRKASKIIPPADS